MRFERCRMLFGKDFEKLQKAKILILGVGGVGSFALDCLYRSGVHDITIVDFDRYDPTNQNRQIGSEHVGEVKVDVLKKLYPGIKAIEAKIDQKWIEDFDFEPYDLVIDAIDDRHAKVALALKVWPKLISSMGSAKRSDPTKIEATSIWKTHGDPFARKIRYELKKAGFKGNYPVIFSSEEPKCKEKGSFVGVTGSFGLTICSKAIEKIIDSKK
ncbi:MULTISPECIES: tRNA threonylcarbamoyladenosine dehydratase [unclassified Nitratiruptor]|uniref:tRNA threonylcarbamoyladenosine dehydratase n=1 Tax=unclassified Nitratiruptor TaxID=2624044 RepID=UPI001915589F|nr:MULTISPECIES: tRNA threonylcarbamoyladenosine dehydratase [unclassified Nitratiruptor]BCD60635.1 MoeB/thiF family protein [Nitratiruptor sp. YY08-10]BCD64566.1 MoeB/thiF family protein [Nitratiruptor sp. YY08-14]